MVAGIDIGSITTDALVFDKEKGIAGYTILQTGADSRKVSEMAVDKVLAEIGKSRSDLEYVISTGCGRKRATLAREAITEITCIAKGVNHLFPAARTIVDIGGQDTKAVRIDGKGRVLEFEMNDKCAAGTGRFIEVMANALKVDLDRIGELSLKHGKDVTISSICTVFAESEVISLVSEGEVSGRYPFRDSQGHSRQDHGTREQARWSRAGGCHGGGCGQEHWCGEGPGKGNGNGDKDPFESQVVSALGAALLALEKVA